MLGPEWGRRHGSQGVSHPTGPEREEQERQREAGSLAGASPGRIAQQGRGASSARGHGPFHHDATAPVEPSDGASTTILKKIHKYAWKRKHIKERPPSGPKHGMVCWIARLWITRGT